MVVGVGGEGVGVLEDEVGGVVGELGVGRAEVVGAGIGNDRLTVEAVEVGEEEAVADLGGDGAERGAQVLVAAEVGGTVAGSARPAGCRHGSSRRRRGRRRRRARR